MSKTKLRKELSALSREQLIEVIIDAYEARKEIKEYFDFFVDPDVDKLFNKFIEDVKKEFRRTKWGMSKVRVSNLKAKLKILAGYKLDAKVNLDAMFTILKYALVTDRYYNIPDALSRFMSTLTTEILTYSDKTLTSDYALIKLGEIFRMADVRKSRISELKETVEKFNAPLSK